MNQFRSPLAVARNHGASGTGSGAFLWERLTSIALMPPGLALFFQLLTMGNQGITLPMARDWLQSPVNAGLLVVFYLLAMVNGYLCSRKLLEDYLHVPGLKLAALLGLTAMTWLMGAAVVVAVFYVTFRL